MPLTNNGRVLLQNRMDTVATHFQLKLQDSLGFTSYSTPQTLTFEAANALAGLRMSSAQQTNVAVCDDLQSGACDFTRVLGVRLVNNNASQIYMEEDFSTLYTFTNDGVFTLSQLIVSFAWGDIMNVKIEASGYMTYKKDLQKKEVKKEEQKDGSSNTR